jgi:hypothetical protein
MRDAAAARSERPDLLAVGSGSDRAGAGNDPGTAVKKRLRPFVRTTIQLLQDALGVLEEGL